VNESWNAIAVALCEGGVRRCCLEHCSPRAFEQRSGLRGIMDIEGGRWYQRLTYIGLRGDSDGGIPKIDCVEMRERGLHQALAWIQTRRSRGITHNMSCTMDNMRAGDDAREDVEFKRWRLRSRTSARHVWAETRVRDGWSRNIQHEKWDSGQRGHSPNHRLGNQDVGAR
jgi:hypothetical protein